MEKKIKILHLEDLYGDDELVSKELTKGILYFERLVVDTKEKFIKALTTFSPDIVLAGNSLPSFNSHEALAVLIETGIKIPFILLTSSVSAEFAVDILKRGAADYILKDSPGRLPNAIRNSLAKYCLEKEKKHSSDELTKNEQKFRALIENSIDGMAILSAEGKPLYASPAIKNVLGYDEEEVMQLDLFAISHPGDTSIIVTALERAMANPGVPIKANAARMRHKDGNWRWIEGIITNMLHHPAISGIVNNFRDITERILAEEKIMHLNRLYAFTSQINQTIVHATDEQTVFKEACRIAFEIGNFKTAWIGIIEPVNRKINLVETSGLHPEDTALFSNVSYEGEGPLYHILHTKDYYVCNNIQQDPDLNTWKSFASDRGYGSAMLLPVRKSGAIIGTFNLYAADINFFNSDEIVLLQEATANISFALDIFEKEKQRVYAEQRLKKHAKKLDISNKELEQFAYVASHDLQEPLRMVTSFLSQIEKKYENLIDDKGKQYIHFAVDGAKRMRQIILDLLEFSRVGRTYDNKTEVLELDELSRNIISLYRKEIEETNAVIKFNNLPSIQFYKTPLQQVLQNLLGNALKYHKKGVSPLVEISCKEAGDYWQFAVKDNGIGIAAEYFEKVFVIFQRLHNQDEYSGTGIGLAICRKIIENMGGKIWIESEEGTGSIFYFTLLKKL